MPFDDDDAIDVDEALDQVTELIIISADSPLRSPSLAIMLAPVKPARPVLLVMPEDASEATRASSSRITTSLAKAGARGRQLSPFSVRRTRALLDSSSR